MVSTTTATAELAPSRLVLVHAFAFALGALLFFLSIFTSTPYLLLVSGPCFVLSGLLIWVGSRITFSGPLGSILRAALGSSRIALLRLRMVLWIVAGVVITLYGIERLRAQQHPIQPLPDGPVASSPRLDG